MDKVYDVTKFGTAKDHEFGIEVQDIRGGEGDKRVDKLFPTSAGGGGQSLQPVFVNRYRPGNRYLYVRANGTIVQFNAVKGDITFAGEAERHAQVVNTAANSNLGNVVDGIWESGNGGPLVTDPALTSHAAGIFGFITVKGQAIANVNAAVAGDDLLAADPATAGRLSTIPVSAAYVQVDTQRLANMAASKGIRALVTEPPTQPSTWKANLTWIKIA